MIFWNNKKIFIKKKERIILNIFEYNLAGPMNEKQHQQVSNVLGKPNNQYMTFGQHPRSSKTSAPALHILLSSNLHCCTINIITILSSSNTHLTEK